MTRKLSTFVTVGVIAACICTAAGWSQVTGTTNTGAKAPAVKKSPMAPFAGTWTGSSQGRTFVTLRLVLAGDQLSGSLQRPIRIDTDDSGEVKNFSDDSSTAVVQETKLTGDGVLLTVKDNANNEVDRFSMVSTGEGTATLKMLAMAMPAGMAKPKPWKLVRVSSVVDGPAQQ